VFNFYEKDIELVWSCKMLWDDVWGKTNLRIAFILWDSILL